MHIRIHRELEPLIIKEYLDPTNRNNYEFNDTDQSWALAVVKSKWDE